MLFAQGVLGGMAPRTAPFRLGEDTLLQAHAVPRDADSAARASTASAVSSEPPASSALSAPTSPSASVSRREARREARREVRAAREQARRNAAFNALSQQEKDSLFSAQVDSLIALKSDSLEMRADSLATDSLAADTMRRDTVKKPRPAGAFLDDPISGKNTDSLVYDVRNKLVYIYNQGDVTYQNSNLKADFMRIDMNSKLVHAYGKPDSLDGKPIVTKPEFSDGSASYQMDTITYNLDSKKAKIKGVATQQGDGWLVGGSVKKMPDNTINIQHGKYTTCDETDHPHFYLAMTKAKVIPGKKVITGPAYFVMEDVPIYFLGIPEGFFPISSGPKSGLLMPTYGEEYSKGFFLRDLGYYFTLGDYADLAVRGGIYTLGSWEASAASRYIKRYKYSGSFNMEFSSVKTGEKGEPDYIKQNNFRVQWTHSQDAKANPGSTFSASVNFATSGYSRYSATNLNDILATQTNSSISYSKNWAGTPFSLSANMAVSQNSQNQSLSITLPTVVFNVSRFYPFKRKEKMGKDRWYEKISMQYTGKMTNSVTTTESEIFSKKTLDNMKNGIEHSIPVSASFNLFNYINVTPSANYTEKWYFKKVEYEWNPVTNQTDTLPTNYGFYRLYNYNFSVSTSTTVYGMYDFTKKRRDRKIQAIRHTHHADHRLLLRPGLQRPEIRLLPHAPDRLGGPLHDLFALRRQRLRRPVVRAVDVDDLLAVAEPRDEGALEARHLGREEDQAHRRTARQRFVQLPGRLDAPVDHLAVVPHDALQELRHQPLGHARPLPRNPAGRALRQTLLPGAHHLDGLVVRLHVQVARGQEHPGRQRHHVDPSGVPEPLLRPLRADGSRAAKRQYMAQSYYDFSLPWNFGFNYAVNYSVSYVNNGTTGYRKNVTQTHRIQRLGEPHPEDGYHLPGRLRPQGQQADHLVGLHHPRPALLADVLLVDTVRLPPERGVSTSA